MLNSIIFGDSVEKIKTISSNYVDVILTDPPYNASNTNINLPNNKTAESILKIDDMEDGKDLLK
jgi:DNA modification methylase